MKIGVIGLGYWGPNLVRNFLATEGVDGVVCCDTQAKKVQRVKQRFPIVETSSDPDELFERKDVTAIAVATPVSTHFSLGMKALRAGKHLLLEKPMTASPADALALCEEAEKRSLSLMVDHTFLYTGAVRKIREIIDSGHLGDILYFDSVRVNLGLFQHDTNVIWDLAPHDISIMLHLIDKIPSTVSAVGESHFNRMEDMAYMSVRFPDNILAHFHVNWLSPVKIRRILIGGTKHMLVYDDMEPSEKVKVYDKGIELNEEESVYKTLVQYRVGDMYSPQIDQTEALALMTADFVESISTGEKPVSNGEIGVQVVKILDAADKSLRDSGINMKL